MSDSGVRRHAAGAVAFSRSLSSSTMAELFLPLDRLLGCGGDPRLDIDPVSGMNQYGCRPLPCPDAISLGSSTATSISERAYDRAGNARDRLMRSAISVGIDQAHEARIEAMRGELKSCLGLSGTMVEVVFSPSGTNSQLQALFLARALLGPALTTIVVAADQTGSGTADTARGHHFSAADGERKPGPEGRTCRGAGAVRWQRCAAPVRCERCVPPAGRNQFDGSRRGRNIDRRRKQRSPASHGFLEAGMAGPERAMP